MPAGFVHNDSLGDMRSEIKGVAKERGWLLYMDNFLLYRNKKNIRNRVAPDLLIVPYRDDKLLTSSYDIETQPLPLCAIEIVSPSSEEKDGAIHALYVEYLKIPTCVVIWLIDGNGDPLENPSIDVWHRHPATGRAIAATPDDEGKYYLPELQLSIGLKDKSVYFVDEVTGETLADVSAERQMRQAAEQQVEQEQRKHHAERIAREAAQKRAGAERIEREAAQKRAEREAQRAEAERQEREAAQKRAAQEAQRAEAAEDENARLRALLQQLGVKP